MEEPDLDRDPEIEAVLIQQLGQLGAETAGPGGGAGAAWSARRLKSETARQIATIPADQVDRVIAGLAAELGTAPETTSQHVVTVRGTIGSGFAQMNPTYVLAVVDPDRRTLALAAHAKEGLIKQRSAEKAVASVLATLSLAGQDSD